MPIIYRKTSKGSTEIETRVFKLLPRVRSVLILVDGKRTRTELQAFATQSAETLDMLLAQGFIEAAAEAVAATPASPQPTSKAAPASAPAAPIEFTAWRRSIVRALTDTLGPAAETLSIKIEKARSLGELQGLLPQAVQLVASMRGRAASEAFAERFADSTMPG